MSISINDIEVLKDKEIFETSSEKYILSQEYEMIFRDPEFKILGFIGDFMYTYTDGYITKYTTEGTFISRIMIEVEHGTFNDSVPFMYLFCDNILYKMTKNLEIEWSIVLDDYIRSINMDSAGDVFVLFQNSRSIYKYGKDGKVLLYLNRSEDASATTRLYRTYISKGRGFLYVTGTKFQSGKCQCFIDKYNTFKGELIERQYFFETINVITDDEQYEIDDIYVNGDYIYIKGYNYIQKINIKAQPIWKIMFGWNEITQTYNSLSHIEYDNTSYQDFIYFCEDLSDTNGYSYGKMTTQGNLLWKLTCKENDMDVQFRIAIRDEYIYTYNREQLQAYIPSVLAVDNNSLLFETRDNHLVKLIEYGKEYLSSDYFGGKLLYSDEIKDDIPERIYVPLLYQDGYITNEENKMLVFEDENKNYYQDENFLYKRLIAEILDSANYLKSRIKAKSGLFIITKNGNRIRTKEPYKIELTYDVIRTKKSGEVIKSSQNQEILRKNGKPFVYYGLLADYFKFYTALITKRKHNILITKAKKEYICRKTFEIYKYYMRKLKDINILVEYIVQNNVLDTLFPNYIEKLKHHTYSILEEIQEDNCPCYYDLKAIKYDHYTFDAHTYDIDENYMSIFMCKNLPFIKKKDYKPLDIRSMASMVEDETVFPFIMFVNGRAIKWSDMTIVRDWHESFIIIQNMNDDTVYSEDVDCILYPCTIHYGEDNMIDDTNQTGIYFTDNGLFTTNPENISMRIEILDNDIISTTQRIDATKNYIELDLEKNKLSTESNIFVFDKGLFDSDNRYYLQNTGYNIYNYSKPTDDVVFRSFYFIKGLDSKNMIFNIPNTENVKEDAINNVTGNKVSEYLTTLNYNFDFHFSRNKTYNRNIAEAIDYVSSYDISLLMKYYKEKCNMETTTMTGVEVNEKASDGHLIISRKRKPNLDDFIVVYKNGLLYEEYPNITSSHKTFTIPINGFMDDDILEIVHYHNVHNRDYIINIESVDDIVNIMDVLRYDNFLLFASDSEASTSQNLIDFNYINHFNEYGLYTGSNITLTDTSYYGKNLSISGKRQFHYQHFDTVTNDGIYTLSDDFKFTQNKNQYLIFVNNKKIAMDKWELLNTSSLQIQLIGITDVQNIDVFYLPDECDEITNTEYRTTFGMGDVDIPDGEIDVPFDKDVFLVFVDGVKVPNEQIQEIDRNSFRILNQEDIIPNLCICKYIQSDVIMKELISYEELWSNGTESLNKEVFERLFKK